MFKVEIVADIYNRRDGSLIHERQILSGFEWQSWICPCALDAFERIAAHLSRRTGERGKEQNIKVVVYRSEPLTWGEGDLAPFHDATLADIVEQLANAGALDENWPGVDATDDERRELGAALNSTLAEWARKHSITSNVWHEPNHPILELPAYLDGRGEIAISNGARQQLKDLT